MFFFAYIFFCFFSIYCQEKLFFNGADKLIMKIRIAFIGAKDNNIYGIINLEENLIPQYVKLYNSAFIKCKERKDSLENIRLEGDYKRFYNIVNSYKTAKRGDSFPIDIIDICNELLGEGLNVEEKEQIRSRMRPEDYCALRKIAATTEPSEKTKKIMDCLYDKIKTEYRF